jgi:hypothetical protein
MSFQNSDVSRDYLATSPALQRALHCHAAQHSKIEMLARYISAVTRKMHRWLGDLLPYLRASCVLVSR